MPAAYYTRFMTHPATEAWPGVLVFVQFLGGVVLVALGSYYLIRDLFEP